MGPYELKHECVSRLLMSHPLYRGGNTKNTPLYSCKLATTFIMLLCSEHNIEKIKTTASFLSHSSGGLGNLGKLPPNRNVLVDAVASAKTDMLRDRKCRVLAVSLTDLHVFRIPYQPKSIAHSFVLALSIDEDDNISATQYQAFGPPDVGYDLTSWCLDGSPKHIPWERFVEFIAMYETFVKQKVWNPFSEELYQLLFACRLQMPNGYCIRTHTRILVTAPEIESIDAMQSYIMIQ